ncbi:uncharacterized protein LOC128273613 [Anopheles cruzii]|uniref:uncharacterized protein LOC128273613 n=1 Tax=Anopheles cruzii TaxID=68878 RepID=UPI0022EC5DA9|nr:uncharacterized protein LOC128273613 [Anopheles cruzii]
MAPSFPATFVNGFHSEKHVKSMEYSPFGCTGMMVSKVSLGCATLSHLFGDLDVEDAIKAVEMAVRQGINYIDTAPYYGQGRSEEVLGLAFKNIPRQAFYVATKVGRYERNFEGMFDYSAQKTRESVEKSLQLLGVDCIDVVQIHDVEFSPSLELVLQETLPTLEELRSEGKLKFIGVSDYSMDFLKKVITSAPGRFDSVLCYSRNTLIDNSLKNYLPFFLQNKLAVICAAGHALGLLTNAGPQPWHPANEQMKTVCREASEYCAQRGIELGKLAMFHFVQLAGPVTFLAGMQTQKLVEINLKAYREGLSVEESEALTHLMKSVFPKIQHKNWDGIELERYRAAMKALTNK